MRKTRIVVYGDQEQHKKLQRLLGSKLKTVSEWFREQTDAFLAKESKK